MRAILEAQQCALFWCRSVRRWNKRSHAGEKRQKRDGDKCQDSNRLVNRERSLRVCLYSSTASALTKTGRSRLRRPARRSHSTPAVNQRDNGGQNYDSMKNNSLQPSVANTRTRAREPEVPVVPQRRPTCKVTCQERLAVLRASPSWR